MQIEKSVHILEGVPRHRCCHPPPPPVHILHKPTPGENDQLSPVPRNETKVRNEKIPSDCQGRA